MKSGKELKEEMSKNRNAIQAVSSPSLFYFFVLLASLILLSQRLLNKKID
jgi:hypothetical protein